MILPRMHTRLRAVLAALVLASILLWTISHLREPSSSVQPTPPPPPPPDAQANTDNQPPPAENNENNEPEEEHPHKAQVVYDLDGHVQFWRKLQALLTAHEPKCASPVRIQNAPSTRFKPKDPDMRPQLLEMSAADVAKMKQAHSDFVSSIASDPPQLNYVPGTRGIVSTAGGSYLPVLVISIRMLRKTGSMMPVEVFLADDKEYESYICDVILPFLNARCVVLSKILDKVPGTGKIQKYQFKPFAMLFSSFEEILFLDADSFPLVEPDVLFTGEPFTNTSMVTWPDFWASSASPIYYEISSQDVPPMNLRQSTESGEVVISKRTHLKTLLLCTYYNFFGPSHYYRLLSQGASGEGDKETFVAAAQAVGEPFYQVSEPIRAIGHRTEGGMAGSAMVQFDPAEDYALTQKDEWRVNGSKAPSPRAFFIHANFPKFNPATVFTEQAVNPAYDDEGSYTRAWTIPEETIDMLNDVEREFWREIMWTACELEDKFQSWAGKEGVCDGVKDYWNALFA